jgi:UDP-N-acetyl-D-glucosamine dehydrogenase
MSSNIFNSVVVEHTIVQHHQTLLQKIEDKSIVIGIVGLGYVGLPLALTFSEAGLTKIIGIDTDILKIQSIEAGKSYIEHIDALRITAARDKGFIARADVSELQRADVIIICVPTPLNKYREPDLTYVVGTVESTLPYLHKGQLMSLESTTYPGTTEEELLTRIQQHGFTVGEDYFLIFSPEREDPGNPNFNTKTIPKVVGGHTPKCLDIGIALYGSAIDKIVPVSSTKTAEMTKLLENIHRAVNIGLVNEMKIVADRMGIDIYEVIDAAATKPFGFTAYYPGPGLGGHCIPIDPFYLTWKAREYGLHTRFIELAGEINGQMVEWVMGKISYALNLTCKSINCSRILIVGLAYKKNVDDSRESPSIEIFHTLSNQGAKVDYHDPFLKNFPKNRRHNFDITSIELSSQTIAEYDCVVIATDHDNVDYELIAAHGKMIVDCRGRYRTKLPNVIKG